MGWDGDQKMAEVIKQTYPNIKISFVGPPVTTSPDKALNECPAIDFICRREFDFSIVEYANGKPLNEILGVSYKDKATGKILHNPDRPQVTPEQLDEMPWATEIYHRDLDVTFNIQKARTIELCEKLKPLGLTWSCTSRVTTDYDTLKAMKEAGCRLLIVGYESGDPQILKNIKKGATVQRALDFTRDCHKLGLVIHGDFILGLPGETRESIRNTIDFAKQLDCETIQVSIAHAFPGTEFFDYAKENGFITNEAMNDDGGHQMAHIEYPGLPVEYVMEMVHKFYDEYYFRPKAAFRVVWQAIVNRDVPRLYTEAKSFMELRSKRNKAVRAVKEANAAKAQESVSMNA
jgi:radical SAM superfamily enzyme YgiQ (UPF0313 family)